MRRMRPYPDLRGHRRRDRRMRMAPPPHPLPPPVPLMHYTVPFPPRYFDSSSTLHRRLTDFWMVFKAWLFQTSSDWQARTSSAPSSQSPFFRHATRHATTRTSAPLRPPRPKRVRPGSISLSRFCFCTSQSSWLWHPFKQSSKNLKYQ